MSWYGDDDTNKKVEEYLIKKLLEQFGINVEKLENPSSSIKSNKSISDSFRIGLNKNERVYFDFGSRILELFYKHFPDKFEMDFIKIYRIMTRAYLAILSSQMAELDKNGKYENGIPRNIVNEIVHVVSNEMGHKLAELGLAKPYVEGENRDKEESGYYG